MSASLADFDYATIFLQNAKNKVDLEIFKRLHCFNFVDASGGYRLRYLILISA